MHLVLLVASMQRAEVVMELYLDGSRRRCGRDLALDRSAGEAALGESKAGLEGGVTNRMSPDRSGQSRGRPTAHRARLANRRLIAGVWIVAAGVLPVLEPQWFSNAWVQIGWFFAGLGVPLWLLGAADFH